MSEKRNLAAREAILASVRASLRRTAPLVGSVRATLEARLASPTPNLQPRADGDLADRFTERLAAVSGIVVRVGSLDDVPAVVSAHIEKFALPPELVMAPAPALDEIPWPNTLGIRRGRSHGDDRVSLTGAFAGVAETGTLVLVSGAGSPTTLNFLPDDHIVVLRESRLVRYLEDAWALLREESGGMPRTVNCITGPSKTADVEQVIQEGAHGPRRLLVVLVKG